MKNNILLILLFLCNALFSQEKFKFDFDYSRFLYNDSSGYIEFYYNFYPANLSKINKNGKDFIGASLELKVLNTSTGDIVIYKTYKFEVPAGDLTGNLTGLRSFQLPFGNYQAFIKAKDIFNQTSDSIKFSFEISKYSDEKFSLSDIQISSEIKDSDENSQKDFIKNNYEIIPYPSNIFGKEVPVIFTYIELYNLLKNKQSEKLLLFYQLVNNKSQEIMKRSKIISSSQNFAYDISAINISKFPSGSYDLIISLIDTANNLQHNSYKRIFLYNPDVIDSSLNIKSDGELIASEYMLMEESELDDEFNWTQYFASQEDKLKWNKLTGIDAKRSFLFEFWKSKDKYPETRENETRLEIKKRVESANQKFSYGKRQGYKTDRGRILITYGEPTEIERFPGESDMRPYEIWKYVGLENGVMFVFSDLIGNKDFVLIHSTLKGELRDDNWQRKVRI